MKQFSSIIEPEVMQLLQTGAVGVLPVDTVYGLVGQASKPEAVARIFEVKGREQKPGTVIAASVDQLVGLGLKRSYMKPVEHYWPGAISVVIPTGDNLAYLHMGMKSLAVRVPNDAYLLQLLEETGPLMTTSANLPGKPTATTMQEAVDYFGGTVDFYVDGGDLSGKLPSTVVRIVDDAVEVLRQGAVKIN